MLRRNSCRVPQSKLALTGDKPMDRSAVITFSGQLREARESALRDSEAFDGIIRKRQAKHILGVAEVLC